MVAGAVFITVDGNMQIPIVYGLSQQDVALSFWQQVSPISVYCDVLVAFACSGEHHLTLTVVGATFGYVYFPLGDVCIAII